MSLSSAFRTSRVRVGREQYLMVVTSVGCQVDRPTKSKTTPYSASISSSSSLGLIRCLFVAGGGHFRISPHTSRVRTRIPNRRNRPLGGVRLSPTGSAEVGNGLSGLDTVVVFGEKGSRNVSIYVLSSYNARVIPSLERNVLCLPTQSKPYLTLPKNSCFVTTFVAISSHPFVTE